MASSDTKSDDKDEDWMEFQPRCGIGNCDVTNSRRMVNIRAFTAIISALIFLEIGMYSYMFGVLRTLEKRFGLRSGESNLLSSIHDAFLTVLVIVIGLFAKKAPKPRLVGGMLVSTVCGAFLFASLHTVSNLTKSPSTTLLQNLTSTHDQGHSKHGNHGNLMLNQTYLTHGSAKLGRVDEFCKKVTGRANTDNRYSVCSEDEELRLRESRTAYALMLLSCALQGIGASALFLGIVYINENSPSEDCALYIGITSSMYAFGSIFGYFMAAICTRLPEDLSGYIQGTLPTGDPEDPRWIGCWWLGFLIHGCLILVFLLPMIMFPKHLQYYYTTLKKSPNKRRKKEASTKNQVCLEIKALPQAVLRLLRKPVYLILVAMAVCQLYVAPGLLMNIARYLEIHFGLSAYMANIFAAVCVALSEGIGTVVGGYAIRRFKLQSRGASRMLIVVVLVGAIGTCTLLSFHCPQPSMAGTFENDGHSLNPSMACNANCSCSRENFSPVCATGSHGNTAFFSPCHTGCQLLANGSLSGCACLETGGSISQGLCPSRCRSYIPYLVVFTLGAFISSMGTVPALTILFSVVDEDEKSLAVGLQSAAYNLLCFVPGPILFGSLIDSACLLWEKSCNQTGSCLLYKLSSFRKLMHGITAVFQFAAFILAIVIMTQIQKSTKSTETDPERHKDKNRDANENTQDLQTTPLRAL